ncbi:phosphotransferase family protein [Telluribacter sp.]|jgi:aminoglycoside phosphotransferase (APT) family kinase protein|uniref:phosphotransferase family protein n=1 Tax=Telluribacter sp. TaxID=1978767 RepID=UPI002E0EA48A|nr:phosphotransferase family protein [Telluribacter sp.]
MSELKIDTPAPVRAGEELDLPRLNKYLRAVGAAVAEVTDVRQFPGGYSNLTYLLRTQDAREYVLRRPPFGAKNIKGGHDMAREYRVLTLAREAGYHKVPTPILLCEDETILDAPFYIMERVTGVILRAHTAPQMNLTPGLLRGMSETLVDNLVRLHKIDIQETGLIHMGKPEGYIQRQVEGWYKRYQASQTDDLPVMEQLYRWLSEGVPTGQPPTLIHNDYKFDNVVLNPDDLTDMVAVLDWEMCTVGDPLMDVGTSLSYWAEAGDGPFEKSFNFTWLPGTLSRREFADRYADQSGRDLSNILYYYVFGLFKNTVVIQQIYARWKKGLTRDERFAGLLVGIKALSGKAASAVESGKY